MVSFKPDGLLYTKDKRVSGQLKEGDWLVLTESKHLDNHSWLHTCDKPICAKDVSRPVWDNNYTCAFCGDTLTWDAWRTLPLCPNCGSPRTSPPVDFEHTSMPYCPHCETEPISVESIGIFIVDTNKGEILNTKRRD
ncbi:hypothetical protein LCGC14_2028950 [marine sediment metagenome]|uniref:Uncharacterized protein n=1 Tax=marine sediment metagenome TaxID=412755 RepID=A0A0F9EVC4_9ZZZZ